MRNASAARHGGISGPQTRPFIPHPAELQVPDDELVGAASVHEILLGGRRSLNGAASPELEPAGDDRRRSAMSSTP